jgi:hypothetical protein
MTEQLAEMTAAIAKADIAMKAAAWQLQAQTDDIAQLRTQDTIVAMRLGGFK